MTFTFTFFNLLPLTPDILPLSSLTLGSFALIISLCVSYPRGKRVDEGTWAGAGRYYHGQRVGMGAASMKLPSRWRCNTVFCLRGAGIKKKASALLQKSSMKEPWSPSIMELRFLQRRRAERPVSLRLLQDLLFGTDRGSSNNTCVTCMHDALATRGRRLKSPMMCPHGRIWCNFSNLGYSSHPEIPPANIRKRKRSLLCKVVIPASTITRNEHYPPKLQRLVQRPGRITTCRIMKKMY